MNASTAVKDANSQQANLGKDYRPFMGARVMWPPDVEDDILEGAILQTQNLLKSHDINKEGQIIAEQLKKYMDKTWEPFWHVFFGKNFGSHITHEKRRFIFFYIQKDAFLLYKIG